MCSSSRQQAHSPLQVLQLTWPARCKIEEGDWILALACRLEIFPYTGGGGSFGAGAARNFGGRAGGATGAGRRIAISAVPLHTRSVSRKAPSYAQKQNRRRLRINDFIKPINAPAEIKLFWELLPKFTSAAGCIDFTGMAIEYNITATHSMRAAAMSDVSTEGVILLTHEGHLMDYAKSALVAVAGRQALYSSSVMQGMHSAGAPAGPQLLSHVQGGQHSVQSSVQPMVAASGGNAFAMLMSQQGSAAPPPGPQLKKGSGYGGAGGSRKCLKCSPVAAGLFPHDESKWVVPLAKHVCWDWLKSQGLDPNLYPHASERQQNKKAGYEKRKRK